VSEAAASQADAAPQALWADLRAYIGRATAFEAEPFQDLALRLYRWQRAHNAAYDAVCAEPPQAARSWQEIPAVPVGLFRDLPLTCFPPEQATVVFRTSGTTAGRRGVCRARDTELYDLGARRHAEACLGPLPARGVSLVPADPDSSLGHMCRAFVPGMPTFFSLQDGVDAPGAWAALAAATGPVFLPGTAFALAELVAAARAPLPLPPGSVVMVTGGSKGRSMQISEAELGLALARLLPGARIVGEYGMTELASQLWAVPWGAPYTPAPWLRVHAVDPLSGEALPAGAEGLLRFMDLASCWTVLALETQDLGVVDTDGRVQLHGRLQGAVPRGCSLSVEEALARVQAAGAAEP